MSTQPTADQVRSALGELFVGFNCYNRPDMYIVVGWTKNAVSENAKRRTVRVVHVPNRFIQNNVDGLGGNWSVDVEALGQYVQSIKTAKKHAKDWDVSLSIVMTHPILSEPNPLLALKRGNDYFYHKSLDQPIRGSYVHY